MKRNPAPRGTDGLLTKPSILRGPLWSHPRPLLTGLAPIHYNASSLHRGYSSTLGKPTWSRRSGEDDTPTPHGHGLGRISFLLVSPWCPGCDRSGGYEYARRTDP